MRVVLQTGKFVSITLLPLTPPPPPLPQTDLFFSVYSNGQVFENEIGSRSISCTVSSKLDLAAIRPIRAWPAIRYFPRFLDFNLTNKTIKIAVLYRKPTRPTGLLATFRK